MVLDERVRMVLNILLLQVQDCRLVVDPRTKESRGFGFVTMSSIGVWTIIRKPLCVHISVCFVHVPCLGVSVYRRRRIYCHYHHVLVICALDS